MKQTKRIVSLLLAVFMIAATFVVPAFADAETAVTPAADDAQIGSSGSSHVEGLELTKVYDESKKQLTLEAYVTGASQTVLVTEPADIALVLDVSDSMNDKIEVANGYDDLGKLDTVYGGAEGIYEADFKGNTVFVEFINPYKLRYNSTDGYWEYYKEYNIGGSKGWTEIGSNYFEITSIRTTKLNAVKMAVKHFIDETNDTAPDSKISIISFSDSATTVCDLTTVGGNTETLKKAVDGLTADGGTHPEDGLTNAKAALSDSDRQKVVIMFTDGAPGAWLFSSFSDSVANETIANSLALKNDGALVYTIGCFDSMDDDLQTKVDKYMNYVSSNYPEASDLSTPGTANEVQRYYHTTDTSFELTEIFKTISQETGGATTKTLNETTVIKDIIGDHFTIPAGGKVTVEVWECTGKEGDTLTWEYDSDWTNYTVVEKTITVTGFDFSENWVGDHSGTYSGKKLVIVIDIDVDPQSTAYGETETNAAGSGVYQNGTMLEAFPRPTCNIPYFTIKHTSGAADDNIQLRKLEDGKVNFTSKVADGYLYGGTFISNNFSADTALKNDPTAFAPTDGSTYWLREVDAKYLAPRTYVVWDGSRDLVGYFLFTTVDSELYSAVGFNDGTTDKETEDLYGALEITRSGETYQYLYALDGKLQASAKYANAALPKTYDDGYLAYSKLTDDELTALKAGSLSFTPYWVTLDGVKVYGGTTRTCTYVADSAQNGKVNVTDNKNTLKPEYVQAGAAQAINFVALFTVGTENIVVDNTVTVTVVDGDTYELNVQPGDIRASLTYKGAEGKVFAGWYLDEEFTTPADLANVNENTTLYARYVDAGYLKVKYTEQRLFRVYGVTFASAIVDTDLTETGFIINDERVAVNVYSTRFSLLNARALFGNGVERGAYMMTGSYSFRNAADGDELTITPYWVTADGTFVTGESRTLVWHPYWVEG